MKSTCRIKWRNPYPRTPTAQSEHVNLVELLRKLVLLELLPVQSKMLLTVLTNEERVGL
jgi:hypothetical protein